MGNRNLFFIIVIFCMSGILGYPATAQQHVRDSLLSRLSQENEPRTQIDLLNSISFEYYDYNDTLANAYAAQARELSEKIGYSGGLKYATLLLGIGSFGEAKFEDAIRRFKDAIAIEAENSTDTDIYAMTLTGECLTIVARYDSAEHVFQQALPLAKKSNSLWLPRLYYGFARILIRQWENELALNYLDSAKNLLDDAQYDFRWLELLTNYGEAYANTLQREKSLEAFQTMCSIADELEERYHQTRCILNRTNFYFDQANYVEALRQAQSALELSKAYKYPLQQVLLFSKIGEIYVKMSKYDLALNYYFQALAISEPLGLPNETAELYNKVAWVYKDEGKTKVAVEFAEKAMELFVQIGDRHGIADVHNTKGLIFLIEGAYDRSSEEHKKALALRKEIGNQLGVIASMFNEALVYEDQGLLQKALDLQLEVIRIAEPVSNPQGLAVSYHRVAGLLIGLERFEDAEAFLKKAKRKLLQTNSQLEERNNSLLYAMLYEAQQDYKKSLEFRKKYEALNDSIFSQSSVKRIAEQQAIYELEKKQDEIDLLKAQRVLQDKQLQLQTSEIQNQKLQIYVAGIFLLVISLFMVLLIRLNSKVNKTKKALASTNEQLTEANLKILDVNKNLENKVIERTSQLQQAYVELDTFFYRSSHDFRRPLMTLIGLADVAKITVKDSQATELFEMVRLTAQNLDKMLFKLQSVSDLGSTELTNKRIMLNELIETSLEKYLPEIERLGIRIIVDLNVVGHITSYPTLISIILDNLIENSLDFSSIHEPYIKITAVRNPSSIIISVEDNGHGIPDQFKGDIFSMYFKGSEKSKGNGLGLYIVSKAVAKLSATITVETVFNKGSKFTVEIPHSNTLQA